MNQAFSPVARQSLSDGLAERIRQLIQSGGFKSGDRLPSIADMARRFGVGHPTLREALKKLETLGIVTIRHGSGVYVGKDDNSLLISNPVFTGSFTRKLLVDLIEARTPIEVTAVRLAAKSATPDNLRQMKSLLTQANENLGDDAVLTRLNMAFHREIAAASGNQVLGQVVEVLTNVFQEEQRAILSIYGSRQKDHAEHVQIYDAIAERDVKLATQRMQAHLDGVQDVLQRWDQEKAAL